MTAFKSVLFFLFVPGLLLGYLPYRISLSQTPILEMGLLRYYALVLWFLGIVMILKCFWDFTISGQGTPAPMDPPKKLVIGGLYRYTRNPIYLGGVSVLLGWMVWSPSFALILAPYIFFTAAHLVVTLYEEPGLHKRFGDAYENYCRSVPRWSPRWRR